MKIVVIDYGSGNLRSAAKAFERSVRALRAETERRTQYGRRGDQRSDG